MSEFNKSYRIRTEVGKDTHVTVKLDQEYDVLEIMSLKINHENAYKFHTSNYGVIAGRVIANGGFGVPNAKISLFINADEDDDDITRNILYPYNSTLSENDEGVRYNLLPNEQLNSCHTVIGTFPEKQYTLDNDSILEVYEKYYKYTTRTNNAGDYMIFGVPLGNQTVHVDVDLSDIGILSQKPRDMVYKGYNITQFENPNQFKHDTNLNSLVQVISQDTTVDVVPFWGDKDENDSIAISRCDIQVNYKFEPTCVFLGSVVSDTSSNGISKKCVPTPGMGAMDELVTGSGTIEMIRKTPDGIIEEFQVQGTQLINGDGVWCYQIPMNLDYMMTDEFGHMVPTNNPAKGIPTRTQVRFRISMQDFESDNNNIVRGRMLVPHNPNIYDSKSCANEIDYEFGSYTKDSSFRDLFWNGVYSVKSFIPRIQKGANWKNEKFIGFKRVNYYGDKNPLPYNNIRIRLPFMFTMICALIKLSIKMVGLTNWAFKLAHSAFVSQEEETTVIKDGKETNITIKTSGGFIGINGGFCNDELEHLLIIPGIDISTIVEKNNKKKSTLLGMAMIKHFIELGGTISADLKNYVADDRDIHDEQSIDYQNSDLGTIEDEPIVGYSASLTEVTEDKKNYLKGTLKISGITVTDQIDYFIQCIEMNLAQEFRVIQFDFYNDWINGLVYIPRWARTIRKKKTYKWKDGAEDTIRIDACNENYKKGKRNIVQQCALTYDIQNHSVHNHPGCHKSKQLCHKDKQVRKTFSIFSNGGLVYTMQNMLSEYVYYFKPYENSNNKNVRLFATDIILLGTLNNCDKWGIPNNLKDLVSSSYQMPPNLAMTDSDLEGNDYTTSSNGVNSSVSMYIDTKTSIVNDISPVTAGTWYVGVNPMGEDGNYTEIAGINWDYTGPLQTEFTKQGNKTQLKLFNPGGHFLGLTCRNSQTNLKTCVNLSRICEYGVWMSQRQMLQIPHKNKDKVFDQFATVPSGFISKDELSDTNYRRLFATMNQNRLRTVIDKKTGYPIYVFNTVNPTNFGGDLTSFIFDNKLYNILGPEFVTEKYYEYKDENYVQREELSSVTIKEKNLIRTGEYPDTEYLKFRFGLKDSDFTDTTELSKRYLLTGIEVNDGHQGNPHQQNVYGAIPMYDNSFYFYFGLTPGKTAIDEFKKTYYSVCDKSTHLTSQIDLLEAININTEYDGLCEDNPSGGLSFTVNGSEKFFAGEGTNVTVLNSKNEIIGGEVKKCTTNGEVFRFTKLPSGDYTIQLNNIVEKKELEYYVHIQRVTVTGDLQGFPFKKNVLNEHPITVFQYDRYKYGGYIIINDNLLTYHKGINDNEDVGDTLYEQTPTYSFNPFNSKHSFQISVHYKLPGDEQSHSMQNYSYNTSLMSMWWKNQRYYTTIQKRPVMNDGLTSGEYMIPVPYAETEYTVKVSIPITNDCKFDYYKPVTSSDANVRYIEIGKCFVKNGSDIDITINGFAYKDLQVFMGDEDMTSSSGWWEYMSYNEDYHRWLLKDVLYKDDFYKDNPVVGTFNIKTFGGEFNEPIIYGMPEISGETIQLGEITQLTSEQFTHITIPTINYKCQNTIRSHFSYQITSESGLLYPDKPFIIPMIYKPFFMESVVVYDSVNKRYHFYGNVYNGMTWNKTEGFNANTFNDVKVNMLTNLTDDDDVMVLNEPLLTQNSGGYNYANSPDFQQQYAKYNGRKATFNVDITSIVSDTNASFKLTNNTGNTIDINIGTTHTYEGNTYKNYCQHKLVNCNFSDFNIIFHETPNHDKEFGEISSNINVYMEITATNWTNDDIIYEIYNDAPSNMYPTTFPTLNLTDELFRVIIDNDKKYSPSINIIENKTIYYPIQSGRTDNRAFYLMRVNKGSIDNSNSTSDKNCLKCVTLTPMIPLDILYTFFNLELSGVLSSKVVEIEVEKEIEKEKRWYVTISCSTSTVVQNASEKEYVFTFYANNELLTTTTHTATRGFNDDGDVIYELEKYRGQEIPANTTFSFKYTVQDLTCGYYMPKEYTGKIKTS